MLGKKGMSPLIATILLMAFAVALGGMIMNWSTGLPSGLDCSDVKLQIQQFCKQDNQIQLGLRNVGEVDIGEIRLQIVDPPIKNEITIVDSELKKGASLNVAIPFSGSGKASIGILPALLTDGEPQACPAPVYEATTLPDC